MTTALRIHVMGVPVREAARLTQRLRGLPVELSFDRDSDASPLPTAVDYCIGSTRDTRHKRTARAKVAYGSRFLLQQKGGLTSLTRRILTLVAAQTEPVPPASTPHEGDTMTPDGTPIPTPVPDPTHVTTPLPRIATARMIPLWRETRPAAESDAECVKYIAAELGYRPNTVREYLRKAGVLAKLTPAEAAQLAAEGRRRAKAAREAKRLRAEQRRAAAIGKIPITSGSDEVVVPPLHDDMTGMLAIMKRYLQLEPSAQRVVAEVLGHFRRLSPGAQDAVVQGIA